MKMLGTYVKHMGFCIWQLFYSWGLFTTLDYQPRVVGATSLLLVVIYDELNLSEVHKHLVGTKAYILISLKINWETIGSVRLIWQ